MADELDATRGGRGKPSLIDRFPALARLGLRRGRAGSPSSSS